MTPRLDYSMNTAELYCSYTGFTVISTIYISKVHLESTGNIPPNALLILETMQYKLRFHLHFEM